MVYSCQYHVVFCPKYQRKVLIDGIDERLKDLVRGVILDTHSELIEMEVMPNHLYLLAEVGRQIVIHRLTKLVKSRLSRLLRMEYSTLCNRLPTQCTNSYFVSTVGGAPLTFIKRYIKKSD